jgi:predicted permease
VPFTLRSDWSHSSAWGQAWRSLRRRPAFFSAAALTLGAGTAITTAVFSLVDTVVIKPLPYPDANQLVTLYESSPSAREQTSLVAPARLEDWQRRSRAFVALSGSYSENVTDTSGAEPERLEGRRVTSRFFTVFATLPLAGRTFTEEEERFEGPGAAVVSEPFWARRFNRDPAAIGRALTIGGRPYPIVGVMPRTFTSAATDVWLPAQLAPGLMQVREARFLNGVGRMRPGTTLEAGAAELAAIQEALGAEFPRSDAGWSVEVRSLKEARTGGSRSGLLLLFGAVALLWATAVANITGLMLVQVQRRARDLAIRTALGASRVRAIGSITREILLITLTGAALGASGAWLMVRSMPAFLSSTARINELALDWRALAFAAGASLLAAVLFSAAAALSGTRAQLNQTIAGGSLRDTGRRYRTQKVLIVGEVAVSLLLVGSATLLLRSYHNLTRVDMGFDASNVVTFHVGARWDEDRVRIGRFQDQLIAELERLPHVRAAGMTNFLPATSATLRYQVRVDGLTGPNDDGSMTVGARTIAGSYLEAIRAPLLAGSGCPPVSIVGAATPLSALVNRRFVEAHASGQNLVGRSLVLLQGSGVRFTIAGVIGDLAEDSHAASPVPYVYTCSPAGAWPDPEYVARTSDARAFATDLRRIVRQLDAERAVFGLRPLQEVLDAALDRPRLDATMLASFAGAAVTLAAIGLYSLFMLIVSDRARELAVRLAVGAAPYQLVGLVMAGAARLLGAGLLLGLALTVAGDRVLRGVLFGVAPLDAGALAAAAVVLAVVTTIAAAGPALRAARTAPIDALRGE